MPQSREYPSNAARQAAYRKRTTQARAAQLAQRRLPPLPVIPSIPGQKRWRAGLEHASFLLETILKEMQDYYEERTPEWQESERAEAHEEQMQSLEELAAGVRELLN